MTPRDFFSWHEPIITMSLLIGPRGRRMQNPKEGSEMAADATVSQTSGQVDRNLLKQVGFIGLAWASAGSIIGSGWLFGSFDAVKIAGPAAIVS
jgi:hypothetical protein